MGTFQNLIGRDVVSPPARLQFLSIAKPDTGGQYSDGRYKATFLFSKTETDFSQMKAVVEELSKQAFGLPAKNLRYVPFRDGDEKSWQGFANSIYVVAKSKFPIDVWSPDRDKATGEIYKLDPEKLYAGCIARAHFAPLAYMSGNDPGITFILNFIQFLEDAPRFGGIGQIDARDVFDEYIAGSGRRPTDAVDPAAQEDASPEADPEPTSSPAAQEAQPAQASPGRRGRPPKAAAPQSGAQAQAQAQAQAEVTAQAAQTADSTAETPSARARRQAAARRAADEAAGRGPTNGAAKDLPPVAGQVGAASAPQKSLMDML